jgi:DnaJ-class molecular chaperone
LFGTQGTGSYIPKKFQCQECKGEKLKTDEKVFTVEVRKGMTHGEKVTFRDEGHKVPELQAGDVVIVLLMGPHSTFTRKGNDLLHEMKISLTEALDSKHVSYIYISSFHVVHFY